MEAFLASGHFSPSELISINCCRLAKCALTVAALSSGDGSRIRRDALLPHIDPFPSTFIWQRKQPSQKDWQVWSRALHSAFGPQLSLAIPLGSWLWPPHQPAVHLPYDPLADTLYQPGHHGVWRVFWQPPPRHWLPMPLPDMSTPVSPSRSLLPLFTLHLPCLAQDRPYTSKGLVSSHYQSSQHIPCLITSANGGKHVPGPCILQFSQTKVRP